MKNDLLEYSKHPDFQLIKQRIIDQGTTDIQFFQGHKFDDRGHRVQQLPDEFAAYIVWLRETFKGKIVDYFELGSCAGGSLRHVFEHFGHINMWTCDDLSYTDTVYQEQNFIGLKPHLKQFFGDSKSQNFKEWLLRQYQTYDVIFIDGDHSKEGVVKDFKTMKEFCKGYIIFHDTKFISKDKNYPCEVPEAIKELKENGEIEDVKHFETLDGRPLGISIYKPIRGSL